jgi:hypothetical protein
MTTVEARHTLVRTSSLADVGIDEAKVGRPAATSTPVRAADFLAERQFP